VFEAVENVLGRRVVEVLGQDDGSDKVWPLRIRNVPLLGLVWGFRRTTPQGIFPVWLSFVVL
jgi:hypothetical protein